MNKISRYADLFSNVVRWTPLIATQRLKTQTLHRIPEPSAIMDGADSVSDFNAAASTSLFISYACALEIIYRCAGEIEGEAIDFACGPGNFSIALLKYLKADRVSGIDLSESMLTYANDNADNMSVADAVNFVQGNILDLATLPVVPASLTTFTGTAHHMENLGEVETVLRNMEALTRDNGVIFVMDLVRLKEKRLTERYVNTVGRNLVREGLGHFYEDFRHSMFAAWTVAELRSAVPKDTRRTWVHLTPKGLPVLQMLIGLPKGQDVLFQHDRPLWDESSNPVPEKIYGEWMLARSSFLKGDQFIISSNIH